MPFGTRTILCHNKWSKGCELWIHSDSLLDPHLNSPETPLIYLKAMQIPWCSSSKGNWIYFNLSNFNSDLFVALPLGPALRQFDQYGQTRSHVGETLHWDSKWRDCSYAAGSPAWNFPCWSVTTRAQWVRHCCRMAASESSYKSIFHSYDSCSEPARPIGSNT